MKGLRRQDNQGYCLAFQGDCLFSVKCTAETKSNVTESPLDEGGVLGAVPWSKGMGHCAGRFAGRAMAKQGAGSARAGAVPISKDGCFRQGVEAIYE